MQKSQILSQESLKYALRVNNKDFFFFFFFQQIQNLKLNKGNYYEMREIKKFLVQNPNAKIYICEREEAA